jgi:large subunit ribosomal protein L25
VSGVRIAAEPRTEFGKGAARRVRRENKVPAVLYGHGDAPRHFSLPGHELMLALRSDPNALIALQTSEGEQLALPKSVVRDPVKGFLEHVDLVAVRRGEKVTVDVAITLTGEAFGDVIVDLQTTSLTIEADATNLPEAIEVDITKLVVGSAITAADVTLPAGASLVAAPELVVVQAIGAPTAEEVEADLAEAEAELGAGQAGAAALEAEQVEASGETQASDVDAGAGTGDAVPETEGAQAGPADS